MSRGLGDVYKRQYWKQPECPSANEWIKKLWYIYTMEFYAAERKKELLPFATDSMDGWPSSKTDALHPALAYCKL